MAATSNSPKEAKLTIKIILFVMLFVISYTESYAAGKAGNSNLGGAIQLDGTTLAPSLTAINNSVLSAIPSTVALQVQRLGHTTAGDGPTIVYTSSSSACSFNGGAGDGGAQVPSGDGKCWLAKMPHPAPIDAWGLVNDGNFIDYGVNVTVTCRGTNVCNLVSGGVSSAYIGWYAATINWHSRQASSLPIIPAGTTLVSVSGSNIKFSNSVPNVTNMPIVIYPEFMTGTDNAPAIQAALDWGMQTGETDFVFTKVGTYLVNDSIQMGRGNTYYHLCIKAGERDSYGPGLGLTLLFPKTDRYAINIQGGRKDCLKGLTVIGQNSVYARYGQVNNNMLSSDPYDFVAPDLIASITSGGLLPNAPYAGITIDARSDGKKVNHYPDLANPAWTGLGSGQYTGVYTSDTLFEDVSIEGFAVDFALGLATDNQGDFTKFERGTLKYGAYGASITNSQSRNVKFSDVTCQGINTVFAGNNSFSVGSGTWGGPISNVSCGEIYQLLYFSDMALNGPLLIDQFYCEGCVRFGHVSFGGAVQGSVIFHGGKVSFADAFHGEIPGSYLDGNMNVIMDGITIQSNSRVTNLMSGSGQITINGGSSIMHILSNPSTATMIGINYTGGLSLRSSTTGSVTSDFRVQGFVGSYLTSTSSWGSRVLQNDVYDFRFLRYPMTQVAKTFTDNLNQKWQMILPPIGLISLEIGSGYTGSGPRYSNDMMTFTYCSNQLNTYGDYNRYIMPGTLLTALRTGTIFIVQGVGSIRSDANCGSGNSYLVSTLQQNNLLVNRSSGAWVANTNPDPTLSGYIVVDNKSAAVLPSQIEYGTVAANCNVTGITRGDGYFSDMTTYLNSGDYFWSNFRSSPINKSPLAVGIATLSSVDSNNGTLVIEQTGASGGCNAGTFPLFPFTIK